MSFAFDPDAGLFAEFERDYEKHQAMRARAFWMEWCRWINSVLWCDAISDDILPKASPQDSDQG